MRLYSIIKISCISIMMAICTSNSNAAHGDCCGGVELDYDQGCCNDQPYQSMTTTNGEALDCCNDEGTWKSGSPLETEFTFDLTSQNDFKAKVNSLISKIPGAPNVQIQEAGFHAAYNTKDCCPSGSGAPKAKGSQTVSGGVQLGVSLNEHLVWPPAPDELLSANVVLGGNEVSVNAKLGVYLTAAINAQATIGYKKNECITDGTGTCSYGSVSLNVGPALKATSSAEVCLKVLGQEACTGFSITPLEAKWMMTLQGVYNESGNCGNGWAGSGSLATFNVTTSVTAFGFGGSITWYTYPGNQI